MREEQSAKISSFRQIRFTLCLDASRESLSADGQQRVDSTRSPSRQPRCGGDDE